MGEDYIEDSLIAEMIQNYGTNSDGVVWLNEFKEMIKESWKIDSN